MDAYPKLGAQLHDPTRDRDAIAEIRSLIAEIIIHPDQGTGAHIEIKGHLSAIVEETVEDLGVCTGRLEGLDLEPAECVRIVGELEDWSDVLKGEPEVIHRLAAFAEAAENASVECADELEPLTPLAPPAPKEPCP